jgi:peptidyl-prolyl cis-trans isomerase SurA
VSNPFKSKFGYHIIQLVSRAGDDAVLYILKIQVTQYEMKDGFDKLDTVSQTLYQTHDVWNCCCQVQRR